MNYKFEMLSAADVVLIGKGIGRLTIDEAGELHQRMQAQIIAQETAERDRVETERQAATEAWRASEREKINAEMADAKPAKSTKPKKGR